MVLTKNLKNLDVTQKITKKDYDEKSMLEKILRYQIQKLLSGLIA